MEFLMEQLENQISNNSDSDQDEISVPKLDETQMAKKYDSDDSPESDHNETSISQKQPKEQILWACENGKLDLVSKLLKDDPSLVNVQDNDQYTPLHRASYNNQLHVIKILLKAGAIVDSKTVDGWTPLHSACKWNNFECASILIDSGGDLNSITNSGQTPLHIAASNPRAKETIQLLIMDFRTNLSLKNSCEETAKQIANRSGPFSYLFEIDDPVFNPLKVEEKYNNLEHKE